MAERTKGSLWRRADESAATEFVFRFGLPHCAAERTLVVKISDTSHLQAVKNPPSIDRTVESVRRAGATRAAVRRKAEPAFRLS
jgi:hypothetical protein